MKNMNDIENELSGPIPRSAVSERQGPGGRSLSYLQAHYVIDRMNKVFGALNWSSNTIEVTCVHRGEIESYGKKKHTAHYLARVQIEVQAKGADGQVYRTSHVGTGYGDGDDAQNPGKAHELAMKEAESDALKRAIKNLGQSMGLALYDKEQSNVADDAPASSVSVDDQNPQSHDYNKKPAPKQERPSAKGAHADRPQGAPTNRAKLNENLARVARILNENGKQPFAVTKEYMQKTYGTQTKEQLSDQQAEELYATLSKLAG